MADKQSSGKGCMMAVILLGVGFGAFALLGIFAAIAVPSFLKYIKKSKAAESKMMVRKIEDSVRRFYLNECKFPQNAVSSVIPAGGAKVIPDFSKQGWKEIGMTSSPSAYFRYRMINEGKIFKVVADADFAPNNREQHTLTITMNGGPDCSIHSTPAQLVNEFK